LAGQELELVSIHRSGGGWRVFFPDAKGRLQSISMAFTDLEASDPFRVQSAGRSYFRIPELLELVRLIAGLKNRGV
jgi:hypothetical protein